MLAWVSEIGAITFTGVLVFQYQFSSIFDLDFEACNNARTDPRIICIASDIVEWCGCECADASTLRIRKMNCCQYEEKRRGDSADQRHKQSIISIA